MCHYYAHTYTCTHTTYALGKYCAAGNLIQTACPKRHIWQTIRMGEDCEECEGCGNRDNVVCSERDMEREGGTGGGGRDEKGKGNVGNAGRGRRVGSLGRRVRVRRR